MWRSPECSRPPHRRLDGFSRGASHRLGLLSSRNRRRARRTSHKPMLESGAGVGRTDGADNSRARAAPRADAAAWALIDVLPAHPIITAPVAAAVTHRAKAAIYQALSELQDAGVLVPLSPSRRNQSREAVGLLDPPCRTPGRSVSQACIAVARRAHESPSLKRSFRSLRSLRMTGGKRAPSG